MTSPQSPFPHHLSRRSLVFSFRAACECDPFEHPLLDLSLRDHLLPQIVLIPPDTAVPPPNRLVLTYHDILRNLVKQPVHFPDQPTTLKNSITGKLRKTKHRGELT